MVDMELLEALSRLIDQKLDANNEKLRAELSVQMQENNDTNNEKLKAELSVQMQENNDTNNEKLKAELYAQMQENNDALINKVNAILETKIIPQIQLIAEQHGELLKRFPDREDLDELKSRVRVLEDVVATHTEDIKQLKKAQ